MGWGRGGRGGWSETRRNRVGGWYLRRARQRPPPPAPRPRERRPFTRLLLADRASHEDRAGLFTRLTHNVTVTWHGGACSAGSSVDREQGSGTRRDKGLEGAPAASSWIVAGRREWVICRLLAGTAGPAGPGETGRRARGTVSGAGRAGRMHSGGIRYQLPVEGRVPCSEAQGRASSQKLEPQQQSPLDNGGH